LREIYIDPAFALGHKLLDIEKPARYTGGEVGCIADKNKILKTLIAFPDLYEIGMGNQALRIIYNYMNNMADVCCDRAFAPAPDFEKLLRENNLPLYGLDTGISLASLDILMFTLGYELGFNGILTMLDVSGIPLKCEERKDDLYPIIIAGGPAVSNPLPYCAYIDAFWIGEAEAGFFDLTEELSNLKKEGESRGALLEKIISHPNIWTRGKEKAVRAIYRDFGKKQSPSIVYPVPSMKTIQNHGTVEIMRGCPNGCRFCHAGFWYRPARQKSQEQIIEQVNELVTKGGWQEISLSSLSSGDYTGIEKLIETLNLNFSNNHVSFQLPSLKVSSFALSLLEKISVTRKSGLTFAVETPQEAWQMSINKDVNIDYVVEILQEAKKRGYRGAKFYFMIGLIPETDTGAPEEDEIVSFITEVSRRARMHFNINVGIFIPKPHTPYQWAAQLNSETAEKKLYFIRSKLKPMGHKVSISDFLISQIEGVLSRGDERSGLLCEEAFRFGSRLEPWNEYINKEKWQEILEKNSDYVSGIFEGKIDLLPWSRVDSCVTDYYLKKEFVKTTRTPSCREKCSLCGVNCLPEIKAKEETKEPLVNHERSAVNAALPNKSDPPIYRVLFSFSKEGSAVFHGHLSLIEIFSMSFKRAGIPIMYTKGFNPLAKIEFASPLSTGVSGEFEMAIADFLNEVSVDSFVKSLNANLPSGIIIKRAEIFLIKSGEKKHSLSSLLWGYSYKNAENIDYVNSAAEKAYRQSRLENDCASVFDLKRTGVLAKNSSGEQVSYFDAYRSLYKTPIS